MMCNYNGILVQDINEPTRFVKRFKYLGINAFWQFPLRWIDDREARELTKEQSSKEVAENSYVSLEFISNSFLYQRYIKKCKELKLRLRARCLHLCRPRGQDVNIRRRIFRRQQNRWYQDVRQSRAFLLPFCRTFSQGLCFLCR